MSTYLVDSPSQTVDDLIQNVVSSTRLPIAQITFTPQVITGFLQDEQQTTVESLVRSVREDYWVTNYDQVILANTYEYDMPSRAVAGGLRKFVFVDPSGYEIDCPHLDEDQVSTPSYFAFRPSWQGQGAFIRNDKIVLWPQTFSNVYYKLRQRYERRPNSLTSATNCAQVTAVNVASNQASFAGSPPFTAGQSLDIISSRGQFTSDIDDAIISGIVGGVVTFDPSTPISSKVKIGDWACPSGLTCIPQLPAEGYPLLLARGCLRIASAMQNTNLFNVASKMAEDAAAKLMTMLTPRVSGSPKKFVNKNTLGGFNAFPYYR